ncbi:MAG: YicC/YloC family endoribonuclease [Synergistes sp.]|nr:YicC/YloC family endoribonuclease [Synergistes sp.]
MYISMTGFGRAQSETQWGVFSLEVSSVNHRYQEIAVRLPREFASFEPWFHQNVRKMFRRGKIQIRLEVLWAQSFRMAHLDKETLINYCNELAAVKRELLMPDSVNVETVASFPGVLDTPKIAADDESSELETIFDDLLKDAVSHWQSMRETEGEHLRGEVLCHLDEFERIIASIDRRWQPTRDAAFEAMKERVTDTLAKCGCVLEEQRFMQEIVLLTDKWDVAEELARLKSHILKFREIGDADESTGRKLDFIIQEMNREVNTLDSKIADADIRWLAVDAKAALERIREQIQNIE